MLLQTNPAITGTQINYYMVCKRKLWLFSHNITMKQTSETVEMGGLLHEHSYTRKKKEITIDGIKLDFFDVKSGVIHEVKKSKAIEKSHIYQLKYYIYYLKNLGLDVTGEIDYPLIKRKEKVALDPEDAAEIERTLNEIQTIIDKGSPHMIYRQWKARAGEGLSK